MYLQNIYLLHGIRANLILTNLENMKKLLIILVATGMVACNPSQNETGNDSSGAETGSTENMNNSGGSSGDSLSITTTSVDTSVSNFITMAAVSNVMEVEASEIAQKKASDQNVRSFAAKMVEDHGNALRKLSSLAKKKKVELPVMVDANRNWTAAEESPAKTRSDEAEKYGSQSRPGRDVISNDSKADQAETNRSSGAVSSDKVGTANATYLSHQEKLNRLKLRTGADFDREYAKMMIGDHAKAISMLQKASQNNDSDIRSFAQEMLPTIKEHEASSKALLKKIQ